MGVFLRSFILIAGVLSALVVPRFSFAACTVGSHSTFVTSCVNFWEGGRYTRWRLPSHLSATGDLPPRMGDLRATPPADAEILEVRTTPSSMVRVRVRRTDGDGTVVTHEGWVSGDTLACSSHNFLEYAPPVPPESEGACRVPGAAPSAPRAVRDLAPAASRDVVLRVMERAGRVLGGLRARGIADLTSMMTYFERQPLSVRAAILQNAHTRITAIMERVNALYTERCANRSSRSGHDELREERGERLCGIMRRTAAVLASFWDEPGGAVTDFPTDMLASRRVERFSSILNDEITDSSENPHEVELPMRMILFYGLGLSESSGLSPELRALREGLSLWRDSDELAYRERVAGLTRGPSIVEISDGYLFGGTGGSEGRGMIDCSALVSGVLGISTSEEGRGRPRTADFRDLHAGLMDPSQGFGRLASYRNCFHVVNMRVGDVPAEGDIVVVPGHMALVTGYSAETGTVTTLEANSSMTGSVGTVRRPLFEPPCSRPRGTDLDRYGFSSRPLLGDTRLLRFVGGTGCPANLRAPLPGL